MGTWLVEVQDRPSEEEVLECLSLAVDGIDNKIWHFTPFWGKVTLPSNALEFEVFPLQ